MQERDEKQIVRNEKEETKTESMNGRRGKE